MNYKVWLRLFFLTLSLLLLLIVSFIYYVDPYQFFHKHSYGFSTNQRYQNLGLINSYLDSDDGYDSILIGTSLEENFYPSDVQQKMKWGKVIKLCASGAVPLEQNTFLLKALETGKVKNVLWEVAIHKFSVDKLQKNDGLQVHTMPFDLYLKNAGALNYLLNQHVLNEAWNLGLQKKEYVQNDLEILGNWNKIFKQYFKRFGSNDNLIKLGSTIDEKLLNDKNELLKSVENYPEINNYLLPIIHKYPNINFYLFIPPYSKAYYINKKKTALNREIMMAGYLVENLSQYKNVKLYGFDTDDFTEDLTNYRDKVHYSEDINKLIIMNISKNINQLTEENIAKYIGDVRQNIYEYQRHLFMLSSEQNKKSKHRSNDLKSIKQALIKYYQDNGKYPISIGFDGLYTQWGKQGEDWIEGLSPTYIKILPRDPRKIDDPNKQYYYKSNGKDYKLIGHGVEDCHRVKLKNPELIDPKRDCWAYGFWTEGAMKW